MMKKKKKLVFSPTIRKSFPGNRTGSAGIVSILWPCAKGKLLATMISGMRGRLNQMSPVVLYNGGLWNFLGFYYTGVCILYVLQPCSGGRTVVFGRTGVMGSLSGSVHILPELFCLCVQSCSVASAGLASAHLEFPSESQITPSPTPMSLLVNTRPSHFLLVLCFSQIADTPMHVSSHPASLSETREAFFSGGSCIAFHYHNILSQFRNGSGGAPFLFMPTERTKLSTKIFSFHCN